MKDRSYLSQLLMIILVLSIVSFADARFEGYDLSRLDDIKEESKTDASYNVLYNQTLEWLYRLDDKIMFYEEQHIVIMKNNLSLDISDDIANMKQAVKDGRYEDAETADSLISEKLNLTIASIKEQMLKSGYSKSLDLDTNDLKELFLLKEQLDEIEFADGLILKIEEKLKVLSDRGVKSSKIADILDEARYLLAIGREYKISSLIEDADDEYNLISKRLDALDSLKEDVKRFGLNSEYDIAFQSLDEEKIDSLRHQILEKKSQDIKLDLDQPDIISFLYVNLISIIVAFLVILLTYVFIAPKIRNKLKKDRLMKLQDKKNIINEQMILAQKEYFLMKKISKKSYEVKMDGYRKKLVWLVKEIALLKNDDKIK